MYYIDETWENAGHTKSHMFRNLKVDKTVKFSRQAFLSRLSEALKNQSGKTKKLIFTHIGSETGFEEVGLWMFESIKSDDYHVEIEK